MIENIYGLEPLPDEACAGTVAVQYDPTGFDIGVGITFNRAELEKYLRDNPGNEGLSREQPDNGVTFFVRLERASTNRLIRLLRKARDSAFGRDE